MSRIKLVVNEKEGSTEPDICGTAIELINSKSSGATKVSLAKLIISPGQESRRHYHKETEEIYFITSGSGYVVINEEKYEVGPGDAIFLPIGSHHQIFNTSKSELIFLCADAPVFNTRDVFEV